jgi:chorismate dehydratase
MDKIKISAVSYLNTKPLLYGILQHPIQKNIDLTLDIPSVCAEKLRSGAADLGLVPVAILPELKNSQLISDYCIGATGAVATVCVFSQVPIEDIEQIYLDYHSRTSVELLKILLRNYWKMNPLLLPSAAGYEQKIKGSTAALIIGDRAVGLNKQYPYVYDLGAIWTEMTQLPFVFAAWVSCKPLEARFIQQFNQALKNGIQHIPQLTYLLQSPHPDFDLKYYYTNNISYHLDEAKKKGLKLFLSYLEKEIFVAT